MTFPTSTPSSVASSLVALNDAPPDQCGAIVWWRLSGGLDLDVLTPLWTEAGLNPDLLPKKPSQRVALRRTARSLKAPGEIVVLRDGFALGTIKDNVAPGPEDFDTDMKVAVRGAIKLDASGALLVRGALDPAIAAWHYAEHLSKLSQHDTSSWLSDMITEVDAIPLRDTGGVYFVPRYALGRWNAMIAAIRSASAHTVSCVPAMSSGEAASAFLDAMRTNALKAAEELAADSARLDDNGDADLGPRALRARVARTEALEAQVSKYEEILGGKLDDVRDAILNVRAQLTVAITLAETAEAKAAE